MDTDLYVWGAYIMGVALAIAEVGLLGLRDSAIRRFFGWPRGYRPPDIAPGESVGSADGSAET